MKRLWVLFTLLASALLTAFITAPKTSAGVQDFSFDSFSANYYLTRDTQKTPELRVDEVLVARFPDFDQNHGIHLFTEDDGIHGNTNVPIPFLHTAGKNLEMTYLKAGDEKSRRMVKPFRLGSKVFMNREFLGMDCFCLDRKSERVFRVDRILELKLCL